MLRDTSILITIFSTLLLHTTSRTTVALDASSIRSSVCDKAHVKSQIKQSLDIYASSAQPSISVIQYWTAPSPPSSSSPSPSSSLLNLLGGGNKQQPQDTTTTTTTHKLQAERICDENVKEVANTVSNHLNKLKTEILVSIKYIQTCGYDSNPLNEDHGVSVDDVSASAYRVVDLLKPTFEQVSDLSSQFPLIGTTCNGTLTELSTGLSALIGACSEQINLFDIGFFKLVGPKKDLFSEIGNHFASFIGGFM